MGSFFLQMSSVTKTALLRYLTQLRKADLIAAVKAPVLRAVATPTAKKKKITSKKKRATKKITTSKKPATKKRPTWNSPEFLEKLAIVEQYIEANGVALQDINTPLEEIVRQYAYAKGSKSGTHYYDTFAGQEWSSWQVRHSKGAPPLAWRRYIIDKYDSITT